MTLENNEGLSDNTAQSFIFVCIQALLAHPFCYCLTPPQYWQLPLEMGLSRPHNVLPSFHCKTLFSARRHARFLNAFNLLFFLQPA